MAVRYYLSQILPPDPAPPPELDLPWKDYWRLSLDDAVPRVSFTTEIPRLPDGLPAFAWGLAYVKGEDFTGVDADIRNFRLFQGHEGVRTDLRDLLTRLDAQTWSNLTQAMRTNIRARLASLGISTADVTGTVSLRAIMQKVGRHLRPGFNELTMYVG